MANVTDPLIASLSGSDPQNLIEYITRQKIYDSRYWKETCFGLTIAQVLEHAARLECIGGLGTHFLALTLKLLQLHPDPELITETFIEQDEFKYVRALGCLHLRLVGRPVEIYETLEPLYRDARKLRQYVAPYWSVVHMDEWIHALLTQTHVLGLALPRLPQRRILQDAGYLPEGPRPTALQDLLTEYGGPLGYLQHKAEIERCSAAMKLWEQWRKEEAVDEHEEGEKGPKKKKQKYGSLFKQSKDEAQKSTSATASSKDANDTPPVEGSEEYWNEQRAKLGLAPLKKK